MASLDNTYVPTSVLSGVRAALARAGSAIASGMTAYMTARSRSDEVERLQNMSDEELAAMGLKRDGICRYVFRDTFYI